MEDRFPNGRPDLGAVGVQFRDDVTIFEAAKGRMLNAAHMLLSYPALLCGHRLVHEAMEDVRIKALVDTFLARDVIPALAGPAGLSLISYKDIILDRFSNPAIRDQLARIARDGGSKIPVFHSKTLTMLLERGGDVRCEAFFLACFARYLRGQDDRGSPLEVDEPQLSPEDRTELSAPDRLGLLRTTPFTGLHLDQHEGFASTYLQAVSEIARVGAGRTIETGFIT